MLVDRMAPAFGWVVQSLSLAFGVLRGYLAHLMHRSCFDRKLDVVLRSHSIVLQMRTAGVEQTHSADSIETQRMLQVVDIEVYSDDPLKMDHSLDLECVVVYTGQDGWGACWHH